MSVTFYFARHGETQFNLAKKVQGWTDSPLSPLGVHSAYKLGQGLAHVDFAAACASDADRAKNTLSLALESRESERLRLARDTSMPTSAILPDDCFFPDTAGGDPKAHAEATAAYLRARGCLEPDSLVPESSNAPLSKIERLKAAERWRPLAAELPDLEYPAWRLRTPPQEARAGAPIPISIDTRLREWCFGDLEGQPTMKLRNRLFDLFGDDLPREQQNRRIDEIADYLARHDRSHRTENFRTISTRIASFLDDCGSSVQREGGGNVLVVTHAMFIRALLFMFSEPADDEPSRIANASVTKVVWDNGIVTVKAVGDTSHLRGTRR